MCCDLPLSVLTFDSIPKAMDVLELIFFFFLSFKVRLIWEHDNVVR